MRFQYLENFNLQEETQIPWYPVSSTFLSFHRFSLNSTTLPKKMGGMRGQLAEPRHLFASALAPSGWAAGLWCRHWGVRGLCWRSFRRVLHTWFLYVKSSVCFTTVFSVRESRGWSKTKIKRVSTCKLLFFIQRIELTDPVLPFVNENYLHRISTVPQSD